MERPSPGTVGRKVWAVPEQPQTEFGPVHPTVTMSYLGLGAREVTYTPLFRIQQR